MTPAAKRWSQAELPALDLGAGAAARPPLRAPPDTAAFFCFLASRFLEGSFLAAVRPEVTRPAVLRPEAARPEVMRLAAARPAELRDLSTELEGGGR